MMKQVIVLRKDLGMRKGKMVAQGAHASLMCYMSAMHDRNHLPVVFDWLQNHGMTKICVGVDSEAELLVIHQLAKALKLPCSLVLDAAKTEFAEPTYTAVGIGPAPESEVDKVTGKLKLL